MKTKFAIIASFLIIVFAMNTSAQSYDNLWKEIFAAQKKDLPKTVIDLCDKVIKKAQKDNNSGQLLEAYFFRAQNKEAISTDSTYSNIKALEEWCTTAKNPVDRMVIHSVLASAYAQFARENQYDMPTNVTGVKPAEDIREWSRVQFHDAVVKHVDASLDDIALLRATKSGSYLPFAVLQWSSVYYQHDMLHILCNRAIAILNTFRQVADKKSEFDQRMLNVYNKMIDCYSKAHEESSVVLSTLNKIKLQYRISQNGKQYIHALETLQQNTNKGIGVLTEVYLAMAKYYSYNENNKVKAVSLCDEAIARYPQYERIGALKNFEKEIKRTQIDLDNVDKVVYPLSKMKISLKYRNADSFDLSFWKVPENADPDKVDIKNCKLASEQHINLQHSTDYLTKTDTVEVNAPDYGTYLIRIKSGNPDYRSRSTIHISKLKVLSMRTAESTNEIVVMDSKTGNPIEGAKVQLRDIRKSSIKEGITNAQGRAIITGLSNNINYQIRATKGEDKYSTFEYVNSWYHRYSSDKSSRDNLIMMSDRGIYRPGQTVYIKGIAYHQKGDETNVRPNEPFTLTLRDANNQEVSNKTVTTNEFGSFNVQFVLPTSCLNGDFSVRTTNGYMYFRVEEYKRPTFEVTTDEVKSSYSLGDTIHLKGKAKTYSGIPVEGGTAKYTIKRSQWSWWWPLNNEIIKTGEVKLDAEGNFDIPVFLTDKTPVDTDSSDLEADDDEDYMEESNPLSTVNDHRTYYTFNINIDVTNQAGETQSGSADLATGEQSLLLRRTSDEKICKDKPVKVYLEAVNLLHKPVDTNISYTLSLMKDGKAEKIVDKGTVAANKSFDKEEWRKLPSGRYELAMTAKDSQGREVKQNDKITLFTATDKQPADESVIWLYYPNKDKDGKNYVDEQHPIKFYFGTAKKDATVLMDVFANGNRLETKVLKLSNEIKTFEYPYKASYGDGITFNFCFVKDGNVYQDNAAFTKALPQKELKLKWSVFRDKLRPGQKEEWKLNILSPNGKPAEAEMLAYMYDVSLDQLVSHTLGGEISYPRNLMSGSWSSNSNGEVNIYSVTDDKMLSVPELAFDHFTETDDIYGMTANSFRLNLRRGNILMSRSSKILFAKPQMAMEAVNANDEVATLGMVESKKAVIPEKKPALRSNFAETAFFYPQLRTDAKGNVSIVFTLPESLTRWKFQGYAHTKDMMNGKLEGEITAAKDFMLSPNMPRFVRCGDHASIAATVSNMTDKPINTNVKFELFDPATEQVILTQSKPLALAANKSEAATFDFTVTDRYDILGVRMIADGGSFSDGEQHIIPVLSDKVMLTESVPLPIRGNQSREFSLEKLFNNHSQTATKRSLTIEYTGNPAWYAVQALPSLALPQSDNAISWSTVLYANSLASYIANSMPRIKNIFDIWKQEGKSKESLLSNLQKNQELKNILLNESPWVLEAKSEQEQKERLSTLFDLNTMQSNNESATSKLKQLQGGDGGWSWFKGMDSSEYITEYVVRLMARLQLLTGKPLSAEAARMEVNGMNFLHKASQERYEWIKKAEKEGQKIKGISYSALRYLYLVAITDN
jgi:hypothetical protein